MIQLCLEFNSEKSEISFYRREEQLYRFEKVHPKLHLTTSRGLYAFSKLCCEMYQKSLHFYDYQSEPLQLIVVYVCGYENEDHNVPILIREITRSFFPCMSNIHIYGAKNCKQQKVVSVLEA
jgi:hypothetical protein